MTVALGWLPSDDGGTVRTLAAMASLANLAQVDPLTVETAHRIALRVPPRDTLGYAQAIRRWLASNFRFVPDALDVETARAPHYLLTMQRQQGGLITGDCDDAAVLGAALGKSLGLRARFRTLAFPSLGNTFGHVYAELETDQGWLDLDVTKPRGPVESASRTLTYPV
jgi:transglutaminase-like putative cysteine protease